MTSDRTMPLLADLTREIEEDWELLTAEEMSLALDRFFASGASPECDAVIALQRDDSVGGPSGAIVAHVTGPNPCRVCQLRLLLAGGSDHPIALCFSSELDAGAEAAGGQAAGRAPLLEPPDLLWRLGGAGPLSGLAALLGLPLDDLEPAVLAVARERLVTRHQDYLAAALRAVSTAAARFAHGQLVGVASVHAAESASSGTATLVGSIVEEVPVVAATEAYSVREPARASVRLTRRLERLGVDRALVGALRLVHGEDWWRRFEVAVPGDWPAVLVLFRAEDPNQLAAVVRFLDVLGDVPVPLVTLDGDSVASRFPGETARAELVPALGAVAGRFLAAAARSGAGEVVEGLPSLLIVRSPRALRARRLDSEPLRGAAVSTSEDLDPELRALVEDAFQGTLGDPVGVETGLPGDVATLLRSSGG